MKGDAQRDLDRVGGSAAEAKRAERLLVLVDVADLLERLQERVKTELLCPFCAALVGASHEGDCIVREVEALAPRVDAVIDGTNAPAGAGRA